MIQTGCCVVISGPLGVAMARPRPGSGGESACVELLGRDHAAHDCPSRAHAPYLRNRNLPGPGRRLRAESWWRCREPGPRPRPWTLPERAPAGGTSHAAPAADRWWRHGSGGPWQGPDAAMGVQAAVAARPEPPERAPAQVRFTAPLIPAAARTQI